MKTAQLVCSKKRFPVRFAGDELFKGSQDRICKTGESVRELAKQKCKLTAFLLGMNASKLIFHADGVAPKRPKRRRRRRG